MLSREQVERFASDGVVRIGQVLDQSELESFRQRMDQAFYEASGAVRVGVRDLSEVEGRELTYSLLQVVNLHETDDLFHELSRRPLLVEAARQLLAANVLIFRDQSFYKPARHGGEVYLHQDNRYWHLEPANAITVWIALDSATTENGCLHYVLGSHREGWIAHRHAAAGKSILLEAESDKHAAIPFEVPAGHAIAHHCQTLHWSPPNRSSNPRRAHTIEYVAEGVSCRGKPLTATPIARRESTLAT